ncbi:MAG: GldG family protein, partial [Lachnospiraceae bacterium]|nr:GldG family protein [Lachnospiraceae bacterium]
FAAQYTNEELHGNDVIILDKTTGASKFIPFEEMYITDYQMDYSSYNYSYTNILDAEGQITSGINFVTSGVKTKMYAVNSHGEYALGEGVIELVNKANIDIDTFDVLTQNTIPEDCDILFINGPTTDISEEELEMYKAYLDNGGKAILTVVWSENDLTNYYELLGYYGVEATKGVVLENDGNYFQRQTYLVEPFESVTDDISTEFKSDDYVIMPIANILKKKDDSDLRGTLSLSDIVISTEDAYGKTNPESTVIEKEENDIEGPFSLVIQASDTYKDNSSKVVIFASPYMTADEWIDSYECSNIDLFIDSIDWMSEQQSITVPKRNLDGVYLKVPVKDATIWAVVTIIIIPLGFLLAGFVVWYMRRKH